MKPLFSLLFWFVLASVGLAQSLYLNQTGDVGIGTRNPAARLTISTTGENAMRVDGVNPYVLFRDVNDPNPTNISREYGFIRTWTTNPFNPAGHYGLEIGVPPSGAGQPAKHLLLSTNYTPRLTILTNGNVGVGLTNPTHKLEVAGNVRLSGPTLFEGSTHIVGTTLFEGTGFNAIMNVLGSASNPLVNIDNSSTDISAAGLSVKSKDIYGTIQAINTRESLAGGPAIWAKTIGRYSGHFEGGRLLIEGGSDGSRSGGIEFKNLSSFSNDPEGYVGMRDDNEIGIYGFPLGDWLLRLNVRTGSSCSRSAIAVCSDQRLKRDFQPLTGSLAKLMRVQGQHYFWKNAKLPGLQTGFVAQEIHKTFPELVQTDDRGFLSVNYTGLVPHLVEAVKELKAENDTLRSQLNAILSRLATLETAQKSTLAHLHP